jgi:putative PIN family toxin of toxin-antitoxin system
VRAVLDTNIVIAGLLWRGPSHALLGHVMDGRLQCFSSAPLIEELRRVLGYGKLAGRIGSLNTTATRLADDYRTLIEMAIVADISPAIAADPEDDVLLATALGAGAEIIVSGDAHLLNLKRYQSIDILTPVQALLRLESQRRA